MPVWPSELPAAPLIGHRETAPDTALRTSMDAGPAKVRRRFTAGVREIEVALVLDDTRITLLDTFFTDTLAGGTLRFTHRLPRTGVAMTFRFVSPPVYELIAPSRWRATLKLEVLP